LYVPTFQRKLLPLSRNPLAACCFTMVSCLSDPFTLKTEATYFFEISVHFQRTIRRCILKNRTFQGDIC
jgi:hypothetical protein